MSYPDYINEDRRLAILRFLSEENDYSLNDSVMQDALSAIGHSVSRDVILADFAYLEELSLITSVVIHNKIHVAKITRRGNDVAKGLAQVPGIKKPRPNL